MTRGVIPGAKPTPAAATLMTSRYGDAWRGVRQDALEGKLTDLARFVKTVEEVEKLPLINATFHESGSIGPYPASTPVLWSALRDDYRTWKAALLSYREI